MGTKPESVAWVPGGSVRSVVDAHRDVVGALRSVLVSRVGGVTPTAVSPIVAELLSRPRRMTYASVVPLVVSGRVVVEWARAGVFVGSDELWVLEGPVAAVPPEAATITAPVRVDRAVPEVVAEWLDVVSWRVGLGDGDGLNVLVADPELGLALGLVDRVPEPSELRNARPPVVGDRPVTRDHVRRVMGLLLAGEITREAASRWACAVSAGFPDDGDEVVDEALSLLVGIDEPHVSAENVVSGYQGNLEPDLRDVRDRLGT